MENINKINLTDSLKAIEELKEGKITTFFNKSGQLETFFTYKANLIDVHKEKMKVDLGNITIEECGENLRGQLIAFLQKGYKIVLNFGNNENFDVLKFFGQFKWFNKDFFANNNYFSRDYLLKMKVLTENEDWDIMNNFKGGYSVDENSRIHFLSGAEDDTVESFLKLNSEIPMEAYLVN